LIISFLYLDLSLNFFLLLIFFLIHIPLFDQFAELSSTSTWSICSSQQKSLHLSQSFWLDFHSVAAFWFGLKNAKLQESVLVSPNGTYSHTYWYRRVLLYPWLCVTLRQSTYKSTANNRVLYYVSFCDYKNF
jgi:hypothetical protein